MCVEGKAQEGHCARRGKIGVTGIYPKAGLHKLGDKGLDGATKVTLVRVRKQKIVNV